MLHYYMKISTQRFCHLSKKSVVFKRYPILICPFFDMMFSAYNSAENWVKTQVNFVINRVSACIEEHNIAS